MKNRKGFGIIEGVIIVAVVLVITALGWYAFKGRTTTLKTTSTPTTSASTHVTTSSPTPSIDTSYLTINEWGVKFKRPSSLTSMNYTITANVTPSGENYTVDYAYLGSDQIQALADTCKSSLGILSHTKEAVAGFTKVGDYYYHYSQPQQSCTDGVGSHADAAKLQLDAANELRLQLIPATLSLVK